MNVLKTLVKKVVKWLYASLPISLENKKMIKDYIYKAFRPIIKETCMYREWERSNASIINEDNQLILKIQDDDNFNKTYIKQLMELPYLGPKASCYEKKTVRPMNLTNEDVRYLAFYLPQFHTFKENESWWGKGFTEWTNTTKSVPQFLGQYQPRLAGELGYYDLKDRDKIKEQMELARSYGIFGFVIYYYWFDGKKLMEKPLELIMKNYDLDLPFSLCWANENWTKRWDGKNEDVLIAQKYDKDFPLKFIRDIEKYFKDDRYIRVDGKPLLTIYNPNEISNLEDTIEIWRKYCRENGIGEIHLLAVDFNLSNQNKKADFDGFIEFPPHSTKEYGLRTIHDTLKTINSEFKGVVFDYQEVVKKKLYLKEQKRKIYKGIMLGWDNTARNTKGPMVFHNFNFALFKEWLDDITFYTKQRFSKSERLIFINAWNEWAEGTYLEPDRKFGYAALNRVRDCILDSRKVKIKNMTADKNIEIYNIKKIEIEEIFKDKIKEEFYFLYDYVALLKKAKEHLQAKDGIPMYINAGGKEIVLSSKEKLKQIAEERGCNYVFVILQYNSTLNTQKCVKSIKSIGKTNIKIIIVDNGSDKPVVEQLKELYKEQKDIYCIYNNKNEGFAKGNNKGYSYAKNMLNAKYIIMINDDVTFNNKHFLEKVEQIYESWSFSVLGPKIILENEINQNPWNHYVYDLAEWNELHELYEIEKYKYSKGEDARFDRIGELYGSSDYIINPILQGAAYIFSPIFIEPNEVAFDECTFLYGEEFLLSVHCLISGHLMLYSNELEVLHHEGATTIKLKNYDKVMNGYDNPLIAVEKCIRMYEEYSKCKGERGLKVIKKEDVCSFLNSRKHNIMMDLLFCQPGFHGGGEYGKIIFKELAMKLCEKDRTELWIAANINLQTEEWIWKLCSDLRIKIIQVNSYLDIADIVNKGYFDTFYAPAIVMYMKEYEYMKSVGSSVMFNDKTKTKVIGTLHDIRDFELSSGKKAQELISMYRMLVNCKVIKHIITDSNYSKQSMVKHIGETAQRVKVLYAPQRNTLDPVKIKIEQFEIEEKSYFLILHADRKEKNAARTIKSLDSWMAKQDSLSVLPKVIVTGIKSLSEINTVKLKYEENFICVGYVKAEELEYLYKNALALLFISLNEGFGYPPLEAMKYATPVIASNVTAIPEVCGEAVIYCNPYDVVSIQNAIEFFKNEPIDSKVIEDRYKEINSIQKKDLVSLLELIINGGV